MWSRICSFWHSLFRPAPLPETEPRTAPPPPEVEAAHEVLKDLHRKRSHLRETVASYNEFGYEDLARQAREEMLALDRRILELRLTHHAYS